jgi:hypothetical protein
MTIFSKSEWRGFSSRLFSLGLKAEGTTSTQLFTFFHKLIPESGEHGWSGSIAPVLRKRGQRNAVATRRVGHIGRSQQQVFRRIAGIEMNEIFQHGERRVLRGVAEPRATARPRSAVAVRALTVERRVGIGFAQNAIEASQLIPPKAMRPSTFSTWRAPSSVSMASSGR